MKGNDLLVFSGRMFKSSGEWSKLAKVHSVELVMKIQLIMAQFDLLRPKVPMKKP